LAKKKFFGGLLEGAKNDKRFAAAAAAAAVCAGYLTVHDSNALLAHLATVSAAGSRILITAPPTPDRLGEAAAADTSEVPQPPAAAAAAAAEAPKLKLHHSTFEEPTETLSRSAVNLRGFERLHNLWLIACADAS
jgi:hypothetical protein